MVRFHPGEPPLSAGSHPPRENFHKYKSTLVNMKQIEVFSSAGEGLRTADAVAELAGCKVATIDAYLSRGQMPGPLGRVGRTRLWSGTVVDSWLALRAREHVPGDEGLKTPGEVGLKVVAAKKGVDQIPAELRGLRRWTRHDHKRPIRISGKPASCTDPTTWTTYKKAKASTTGDGFGFVLSDDGIAGLDINHCVVNGELTLGAIAILDLLPDTYAEISPSGHGVRLFCRATVAKGRRFTSHGVPVEVYGAARFLTVTGNRLPDRPSHLADHDLVVRALLLGEA